MSVPPGLSKLPGKIKGDVTELNANVLKVRRNLTWPAYCCRLVTEGSPFQHLFKPLFATMRHLTETHNSKTKRLRALRCIKYCIYNKNFHRGVPVRWRLLVSY